MTALLLVLAIAVDQIDAPYMPINESLVENAPRPVSMCQTSYLHLGSDRGGRTAAVLYLYSVTGTCKHHDIDPFASLQDVLRRLPAWAQAIASALPMTSVFEGMRQILRGGPCRFRRSCSVSPEPPLSDTVNPLLRRDV
jgi:hypothetical protein